MADTPGNKVHLLHRSGGKLQPEIQPIVLEYKKKKDEEDNGGESKGKEKYSKGLEDVQRLEGDVLRVSQKAAKAFSKSIDTYESERQKSAKEKTDGAVEDFVHNSAKAASTYMKGPATFRLTSPKRSTQILTGKDCGKACGKLPK